MRYCIDLFCCIRTCLSLPGSRLHWFVFLIFVLLSLTISSFHITYRIKEKVNIGLLNAVFTIKYEETIRHFESFKGVNKSIPTDYGSRPPPILHQSWKSKSLPDNFQAWSRSWRKNHPTWNYYLWSDEDNDALAREYYPEYYDFFSGLAKDIMKADVARAMYMHRFGGMYADLDTFCLRPLDNLTALGSVLVAKMSADDNFEHNIPNAWMASIPGHPFWIYFLEIVKYSWTRGLYQGSPEGLTGPIMLKRVVNSWNGLCSAENRIEILPPGIIYVRDWHNYITGELTEFDKVCIGDEIYRNATIEIGCKQRYPEAHVITFWTHTWGKL